MRTAIPLVTYLLTYPALAICRLASISLNHFTKKSPPALSENQSKCDIPAFPSTLTPRTHTSTFSFCLFSFSALPAMGAGATAPLAGTKFGPKCAEVGVCCRSRIQRHAEVGPRTQPSPVRRAALAGRSSAGAVKAVCNGPSMSAAQSTTVHDGLLHPHLRHCSSPASAVRRLPSAVRTTTPAFDVRSTGLFCDRPGGLELVTGLPARSVTFL